MTKLEIGDIIRIRPEPLFKDLGICSFSNHPLLRWMGMVIAGGGNHDENLNDWVDIMWFYSPRMTKDKLNDYQLADNTMLYCRGGNASNFRK